MTFLETYTQQQREQCKKTQTTLTYIMRTTLTPERHGCRKNFDVFSSRVVVVMIRRE